jgi:predicted Ser/Thr protein kinase
MLIIPNNLQKPFLLGYCETFAVISKYLYGGEIITFSVSDSLGKSPIHTVIKNNNMYYDARGYITDSGQELNSIIIDEYSFGDKVNALSPQNTDDYLHKILRFDKSEDITNCWLLINYLNHEIENNQIPGSDKQSLRYIREVLRNHLEY